MEKNLSDLYANAKWIPDYINIVCKPRGMKRPSSDGMRTTTFNKLPKRALTVIIWFDLTNHRWIQSSCRANSAWNSATFLLSSLWIAFPFTCSSPTSATLALSWQHVQKVSCKVIRQWEHWEPTLVSSHLLPLLRFTQAHYDNSILNAQRTSCTFATRSDKKSVYLLIYLFVQQKPGWFGFAYYLGWRVNAQRRIIIYLISMMFRGGHCDLLDVFVTATWIDGRRFDCSATYSISFPTKRIENADNLCRMEFCCEIDCIRIWFISPKQRCFGGVNTIGRSIHFPNVSIRLCHVIWAHKSLVLHRITANEHTAVPKYHFSIRKQISVPPEDAMEHNMQWNSLCSIDIERSHIIDYYWDMPTHTAFHFSSIFRFVFILFPQFHYQLLIVAGTGRELVRAKGQRINVWRWRCVPVPRVPCVPNVICISCAGNGLGHQCYDKHEMETLART